MTLDDQHRMCPICHQWKPEDEMDGQTWYGDAICAACEQTFQACKRCRGVFEPKDQGHVSGYCRNCFPLRVCSVPGCGGKETERGWCHAHYARWQKTGNLSPDIPIARRAPTTEERFRQKIQVQESGCWLWTGSRNNKGYGWFSWGKKRLGLAHRYSHEAFKGSIPEGLNIDHLCKNPACVNPDHLEAVTQRVNVQRACGTRTHCVAGHELSGDNLYINRRGSRHCRACHRQRERQRRLRSVKA